jgi:hypothetical protein
MRPIGFSTGALAYADFRQGLAMIQRKKLSVVELSALRQNELVPLLNALQILDLSAFKYVSLHAPSQFQPDFEVNFVNRLLGEVWREWPIVVHPDAISDFSLWRQLGSAICVENMDKRKPLGRSVRELAFIFGELPEATFCFDIGHARQYDSTMTEAYFVLREFGARLRQVHVSEVNTSSRHDPLSYASILAFQQVAHLIPADVPLILETPVKEEDMLNEIGKVQQALPLDRRTMVA